MVEGGEQSASSYGRLLQYTFANMLVDLGRTDLVIRRKIPLPRRK